ncbi:hypothetical protein [Streptomyces chiangmaiensis]|uniref:Uncharacterized protein n=1 Tax=Streptomyces chiangmaiensis TaxID=766497 RepID=A0ABU7FFF7_9ACTN|nr:hypothetical protein [Streptomyces chiangmaiensis]MED7822322.1 hypothetical protein [Streptomyces chiangmaiensis]
MAGPLVPRGAFLDLAPQSTDRFASIEDRVARLLSTEQDVVIIWTPSPRSAPSRCCRTRGARTCA